MHSHRNKTIEMTHETFICVTTFSEAASLPDEVLGDGSRRLAFHADPGLCQFSVVGDAERFDWDSMYVNLRLFGNAGQRTGPWDFDPTHGNVPVVPCYWVELDGRRLGLWFFQRISVGDIAAKRLRGNMAFHVDRPGEHVLRFVPHHPFDLPWTAVTMEVDPDDTLEPQAFDLNGWADRCPAGRLANPALWMDLRDRLADTHAIYREPLRRMFGWLDRRLRGKNSGAPESWGFQRQGERMATSDILPLLAMHYVEERPDALATILAIIDDAVAQPHWGNPREDGYGHDGDMAAAQRLRDLAWALHALREHLGPERRIRLIEKLRLQAARFFDLILLHRDYWGGSLIQDHGKVSLAAFGTAALHLLGLIPEADLWAAYALPRIRRSLRALPRDGVIPPSSHGCLYLYLDETAFYRDTLLALTGEDVYDQAPFQAVVDFVSDTARAVEHKWIAPIFGSMPLIGGNAALNHFAAKYRDSRAAWLQTQLLRTSESKFFHATQEKGFHHGTLWGALTHPTEIAPAEPAPRTTALHWYEDSGQIHYYDAHDDVTLCLACGPWCGYNSHRHARGPCDRMEILCGTGHFILALGAKTVLPTPDGGYRLQSALRNVLLVDGQGQYGDIGYPMSLPSFRDRGEEIVFARWDEEQRTGWIRLDLAPAYPEALGIAYYTRDFLLREGREIVCRDRIALARPRQLEWRFHGFRDEGVVRESATTVRFGSEPWVRIAAQPADVALDLAVHETEIVWSYASAQGFRPFNHARFEPTEPVTTATVDFVLTWKKKES